MPKIIIGTDTVFKKRLLGASDLANSEKVLLPKGTKLDVREVAPDRNKHYLVVMTAPLVAIDGKSSIQQGFIFADHIQIETAELNQVIKLSVPYFSQLNNDPTIFGPGWRQCNTTSNAMLADFLLSGELSKRAKQQGLPEPESVYMRIVGKYGDTTDHNAQTKALVDLGIQSYFSYTLSGKDLLLSLRAKIPIVVGFAYKGSGHICVIVGHDPIKKQWLVHDPYGTRLGSSNSYDVGIGGSYDQYSYDVMQQIFWDQGKEAGWGRIVTRVNGKSTGLPLGL